MSQTKSYTRLLMFLLIIGCLAACGNSKSTVTEGGTTETSTDNESESTSPDGESTPKVSEKDNTTTIKSETEDGKSTSTEITEGKSIPEDFPKHIPLPEDAKVTSSLKNTIDGLDTFMLSLTTEMEMEDFHKIYTDYVKEKKYSEITDMIVDGSFMVSGHLDGYMLLISASKYDEADTYITTTISWIEDAAE